MKFSALVNNQYKSYSNTLAYFGEVILKKDIEWANDFFYSLGTYLEDEEAACDKMIINPFIGYSNKFSIIFNLKDVKIGHVCIEVKKSGILKLHNYSYCVNEYKDKIHTFVEDYLDLYNDSIINKQMQECNLTYKDDNNIIIEYFNDYKKTDKKLTLKGKVVEMFDTYTSMNDTLKYCNGDYWKFANKEIESLYRIFIDKYNGNYFLDNAVKRGCLID